MYDEDGNIVEWEWQAYVDEGSGESVSGSRRVAYTDSYVAVPVGKIGGKDVVSRKSPTAFN